MLRARTRMLRGVSRLRALIRRGERMGMAAAAYYTADMVRALNDATAAGPRYETVHGELLVTPSPRKWHQVVVERLHGALSRYLEREGVGRAFFAPAEISWAPDVVVQPDVFVVPLEDARALEFDQMRRLLLAAEVLSPGTSRADRFAKRRLYQEQGVLLYWIVDADARHVEVWTPSDHFPLMEGEVLIWHPHDAREPFRLRLEELFRPL